MEMYQLFIDKEDKYEVASTSIASAREYSKLLVKCAPRSMEERIDLANQWGWDAPGVVKDEIFYEQYQYERACVLFPDYKKELAANIDNINVAEVDRAETFFSKATGLALSEPSLSLTELTDYLSQVSLTMTREDTSQTGTSDQEEEQ